MLWGTDALKHFLDKVKMRGNIHLLGGEGERKYARVY